MNYKMAMAPNRVANFIGKTGVLFDEYVPMYLPRVKTPEKFSKVIHYI